MAQLRVELKCEKCGPRPEYTLELFDFRGRQRVDAAELSPDGTFTLRHVPYGEYQIIVTDAGGNTVSQEFLTVAAVTPPPVIHVMASSPERPPAGPVSLTQLQHPPDRKAVQAALAAEKFSASGNFERAADELEKAVRISPYFAAAYINLAAQHIHLGRYREAESECRKAIGLAGPTALVLTDLASAQYALKEFDEAAGSARQALRLEPDYPRGHLILGLILATDTRTVHDGLAHLEKAAETIPSAQRQVERVREILAQSGM